MERPVPTPRKTLTGKNDPSAPPPCTCAHSDAGDDGRRGATDVAGAAGVLCSPAARATPHGAAVAAAAATAAANQLPTATSAAAAAAAAARVQLTASPVPYTPAAAAAAAAAAVSIASLSPEAVRMDGTLTPLLLSSPFNTTHSSPPPSPHSPPADQPAAASPPLQQIETPRTAAAGAAAGAAESVSCLDAVVPIQRPPMMKRTLFGVDTLTVNGEDDETSTSGEEEEEGGVGSGMSSPCSIRIQCQPMLSSSMSSSESGDDSQWEENARQMLASHHRSPPPVVYPHSMMTMNVRGHQMGGGGEGKPRTLHHKHSFHAGMMGTGGGGDRGHYQNHAAIRKAMSFRAPPVTAVANEYHVQNILEGSKMSPFLLSTGHSGGALLPPVEPPPMTLLEQIVRSHPIWYLQDIDRPMAEHVLRPMPAGTFVVRSCSRPSSMALSIRLPGSFMPCEIDHLLLIHSTPAGLRLQSSPHSFRSLPLLLEHYCSHKEELRVLLRLPPTVGACTTTSALQALALMGIDFWSSPSCISLGDRGSGILGSGGGIGGSGLGGGGIQSIGSRRDSIQSSSTSFSSSTTGQSGRSSLRRVEKMEERGTSFRVEKPSNGTGSAKSSLGKSGGKKIAKLLSQGKEAMTTQLANCALFLPLRKKVSNSRSAMNIRDWRGGLSDGGVLDGVYKGKEWNMTSTFKPGFGRDLSIDDRLNSLAAKRMAEHGGGGGRKAASPSPAALLPPHLQPTVQLHNQWNEGGMMTASQIAALRPPQDALDPLNTRQCVEELRRKRLQSTEELLGGSRGLEECQSMLRKKHQPSSSSSRDSISSRQMRRHRLSAPSFPPESALLDFASSAGIMESAKALRERMDKDEDGGLGTINEGLITPVVRRKGPLRETQNRETREEQPLLLFNRGFDSDHHHRPRPTGYLSSSSSPDRTPTASPVQQRRQVHPVSASAREAIVLPPTSSSGAAYPPTVITPSAANSSGTTVVYPAAAAAAAASSAPFQQPQWSAVTRELRSRQQKVAKVLPTPQTPRVSAEQKMTIRESVASAASSHLPSPSSSSSLHRSAINSDYAQLGECVEGNNNGAPREDDSISVAGTIFDEPWDSNTWENLLVCAGEETAAGRAVGHSSILEEDDDFDDEDEQMTSLNGSFGDQNENVSMHSIKYASKTMSPRPTSRAISHHSLLSMDASGSLRRPKRIDHASASIQQYIAFLATAGGTFSNSLDRFIECMKESNEKDARLLAKNVRQFMNGMKNYLMKTGEGDLHAIIARESARLDRNSILNMDTILEDSLNRLVLKPLCDYIYCALRATQRSSPSLVTLFTNIEKARGMSPSEMGLGAKALTPSADAIEKMRALCRKMQAHYSPHRKLEILLKATSLIFSAQRELDEKEEKGGVQQHATSAEDLVSWLVWLISRTLNVAAEVEALYMNELLPVQLRQAGDGALYLSALDSAIRILSSPGGLQKLSSKERGERGARAVNTVGGCCLIRVAVPDELLGAVDYESFPLVGDTTAVRLCRLIAHQHSITNPQDYGLYLVTDSFEQCLSPSDVIEDLKQTLDQRPFLLAYKRHEARLAWPALAGLATN